jgi:adenylate cyclase
VRLGLSLFRGPGRAVALALVGFAILLRAVDPGSVTYLRLRGFDVEQLLWPRTGDPMIAIVTIDEASIAQYGQWPWPRARLAKLVRRIAEGQPRVLGIDIIFAEPDRLSPPEIARELPDLPAAAAAALEQMPPSERDLADAMRAVPTVLALRPLESMSASPGTPMRASPITRMGHDPIPFLESYSSMLQPVAELTAAAKGIGSVAAEKSVDGIVRAVPLAVSRRGTIVPSFALEILRIASNAGAITINTGVDGIEGVRVGDITAPTDPHGHALIHFADRVGPYISAVEVLDPGFDTGRLRDQMVLLGVTGFGVVDMQQTPIGAMQGIDVHAQLIESMILDELLHRPAGLYWIELAVALAAGTAAIWLLPYRRAVLATGLSVAIAVVPVGAELALFRSAGVLFDGVYSALTSLAAFAVMLVGTLRAEEAELRREGELKQRMAGELSAAQAIQMGLLPRLPAFPDRPDIDLFARIEPARMVGGDFYEYLLVDEGRRLFFLIADVSGKGMPAALFMAMCKAVVREAVIRFAPELDQILAEINHQTTETSLELPSSGGDQMFVTAFAGILDLGTGEIDYASAGHDSPFVLGRNPGLRQLVTEGGPPLGVMNPFLYPIDRARLDPGEVLLLFTDGVTEAQNSAQTLYSGDRLEKLLTTVHGADAEHVIAAVFDDVRHFVGDAEQFDDITVLALRRVAT